MACFHQKLEQKAYLKNSFDLFFCLITQSDNLQVGSTKTTLLCNYDILMGLKGHQKWPDDDSLPLSSGWVIECVYRHFRRINMWRTFVRKYKSPKWLFSVIAQIAQCWQLRLRLQRFWFYHRCFTDKIPQEGLGAVKLMLLLLMATGWLWLLLRLMMIKKANTIWAMQWACYTCENKELYRWPKILCEQSLKRSIYVIHFCVWTYVPKWCIRNTNKCTL